MLYCISELKELKKEKNNQSIKLQKTIKRH